MAEPNFDELFECSWGDIRLFAGSIEWEAGNTQVVHDLASGDEHPVQPRGKVIGTAKMDLLFDDFGGESGVTAFRRFLATTSERRIFTHPMVGSYFARIGKFTPTMSQDTVTTASVEIIPDQVVQPVSPAGAGSGGLTGETAVAAAADEVSLQLSESGVGFEPKRISKLNFRLGIEGAIDVAFSADLSVSVSGNVSASATASAAISASVTASLQAQAQASFLAFATVYKRAFATASTGPSASVSGMPDPSAFAFATAAAALDQDARAAVASWNEEDVSVRKVMIDATRLSESLAAMIEIGGLERDHALWPAYVAAIMLGDAIRAAALSVMAETGSVFVMRIQRPTALLPLMAKVYGGFDAQARARQVAGLNDIRTPGWLEVGDYLMPARPSSTLANVEVG